jgi:hypothetical protein
VDRAFEGAGSIRKANYAYIRVRHVLAHTAKTSVCSSLHGGRSRKRAPHDGGAPALKGVRSYYFFGAVPPVPVPVLAVSCTKPLLQAAVNSACDSLPSLLASAALKSFT